MIDFSEKKIVIFDLDDTLAESKKAMDLEMSELVNKLLEVKKVAVISGGAYAQYQKQFLVSLNAPESLLSNLWLFPTCATVCYQYVDGDWSCLYSQDLTQEEKEKIFDVFEKVIQEYGHAPEQVWGDMIEDRGTQITFSALGQQAPIEAKRGWDPDSQKRLAMKVLLEKYVPEFEVRTGGTTSIDITRKGIDKAYGIRQIEKLLGYTHADMLFVGDALHPGGNDYPVKAMGVDSIAVTGHEDTKQVIREILK